MEKNKDLISLNSKGLNEASIEELEERMVLACWLDVSQCDAFDKPPPPVE